MNKFLWYIGLICIFGGCLKTTPYCVENIFLGSLDSSPKSQPNTFLFECPSYKVLTFCIGINQPGNPHRDIEDIRETWEAHYCADVRIYDCSGTRVFSEVFNKTNANISTGANWLNTDISVALQKSKDMNLNEGETYKVEIILTGSGLENSDLIIVVNRVFAK
jgi:hypothetical protein